MQLMRTIYQIPTTSVCNETRDSRLSREILSLEIPGIFFRESRNFRDFSMYYMSCLETKILLCASKFLDKKSKKHLIAENKLGKTEVPTGRSGQSCDMV